MRQKRESFSQRDNTGKGAQVDLPRKDGGSPLLISALQGHAACVRLLLEHGADPLPRTDDGHTALDLANRRNHPEVMALLQARIAELTRARP